MISPKKLSDCKIAFRCRFLIQYNSYSRKMMVKMLHFALEENHNAHNRQGTFLVLMIAKVSCLKYPLSQPAIKAGSLPMEVVMKLGALRDLPTCQYCGTLGNSLRGNAVRIHFGFSVYGEISR